MEMTVEQIRETVDLFRTLTLREAMILIALERGTFSEARIGTSLVEAMRNPETAEKKLIALGLLVDMGEWLEPTPKGIMVLEWFMEEVLDQVMGNTDITD